MPPKRVAVVQPVMVPGGGTEAVTAWTVEALKNNYEVSLVSFSNVSIDALNRYYGTHLAGNECSLVRPNLPPFLRRTNRFLLLKDHLMMRQCKSMGQRFDLFISVGGAMDFGTPSFQYMALAPGSTLVKVLGHEPGMGFWFHLVKRAIMRLSELLSSYSPDRVIQNTTLVTSRWAGQTVERLYGIRQWQVVYPPVNSPPARTPWSDRESGFLCVARISPEKQIERAIEIVRRVRERGFDVSLRIAGRQDSPQYLERVQRLCQQYAAWIALDGLLSREDLGRLMDRYRYGINAASDEPFGIALAEMVNAGCIVFVPDSGGQTEIADDPRLAYSSTDEAVEKIARVLGDEELQQSMRSRLDEWGKAFSTHAFCASMRRAVGRFFED